MADAAGKPENDSWPPDIIDVFRASLLGALLSAAIGFPCGWLSYSFLEQKYYNEFMHGVMWAIHFGSVGAFFGACIKVGSTWIKSQRRK
jgi:hypothetical protein